MSIPDRVKIWLTSVNPSEILPLSYTHTSIDLSVDADI